MPATLPPPDGTLVITVDENLRATGLTFDTTEIIIPAPGPTTAVLALQDFTATGPPGAPGPPGPAARGHPALP
jgi:hypothetical protein